MKPKQLFMKLEEKTKRLKKLEPDKTRVPDQEEEIELDDQYKIDLSKLSLGAKFARGSFCQLYHGIYNDKVVAVKIIEGIDDRNDELVDTLKKQFNAEVTFLSRLHHPNIIKFVGACKVSRPYVITEYVSQGSLKTYLHNNKSIPVQRLIKMALDIARGMEYIHAHGVIHKDLKPDNILIDENYVLKIADFGISCQEECCNRVSYGIIGTYRWMAPELINQKSYGHKVDVYSYGIILWELLTGTIPYENLTPIQAAFAVSNKNLRPFIPQDCPPALRSLIEKCWSSHPEKRPEFWQIVKVLEQFESSIARDGTLNVLQNTTFLHNHRKNRIIHFIQKKLGVFISPRNHAMVH